MRAMDLWLVVVFKHRFPAGLHFWVHRRVQRLWKTVVKTSSCTGVTPALWEKRAAKISSH